MNIQEIKNKIGNFANDIKLNLSVILTKEGAPDLNTKQIYGIALASAYATRNLILCEYLILEAKKVLSDSDINAAKSAVSVMAMNNVYYRFVHLVQDKEFARLPARLRMNVIGNPGVDKIDFELYSLAVSAINGCGMCMDAHVNAVKASVSNTGIQSCVRIAAVINGVAQALMIVEN